ncbi:MAG: hypothetical protein ABI652_07830 [Acidobacteriota bacterium]
MPTATPRIATPAPRFALALLVWSLGLFGLLRLPWVATHLLLPMTRFQGVAAAWIFGPSTLPVEVTLACSGADALALCVAAVLAYPSPWRLRIAGAAVGMAGVLTLNTIRIGTLGQASAWPRWFDALHVYIWPAILTLAITAYVFRWMKLADGVARDGVAGGEDHSRRGATPDARRRFLWLTLAFVLIFSIASPLYLESTSVLALAGIVAHAAARLLSGVGIAAQATDSVLWTARGGFLVTQECISTPLIPVYLAAAVVYSGTRLRLALALMATVPLFMALGVMRLLVVALPGAAASPLFLVHAFYQLLLGVVVVGLAALWRHSGAIALRHALLGLVAGILVGYVLAPLLASAVASAAHSPLPDPQGALAMLPSFQLGLYVAVWIAAFGGGARPRFLLGLALLALTQGAGLLALHLLNTHVDLTAHVRDIRGWAVGCPLLILALVAERGGTRR